MSSSNSIGICSEKFGSDWILNNAKGCFGIKTSLEGSEIDGRLKRPDLASQYWGDMRGGSVTNEDGNEDVNEEKGQGWIGLINKMFKLIIKQIHFIFESKLNTVLT